MNIDYKYELVIPSEDPSFRLSLLEGKDGNYHISKHWHRFAEIFLVLEGQMESFISNKRLPLKAADFVIVSSNEIHSIEVSDSDTTIVMQIPVSCFERYLGGDDYAPFTKQSDEDNLNLVQLIVRIYRTYVQKEFAYELKVKSLFMELLYLPVARFMQAEGDLGNIRHKRHLDKLSNITAYIKNNYNKDIPLEGLAVTLGSSPTYPSRMFKRYASISYKTRLLDLHTEYGLREMMDTSHSLAEVALNNGFPNGRAFSKAFSKRYGCLPSEYRRMMEGEVDDPGESRADSHGFGKRKVIKGQKSAVMKTSLNLEN